MDLRDGGLDQPVLVLAEPPLRQLVDVARLDGVRPTLYTSEAIAAAAKAVRDVGRSRPLPVHLKVDTGMHRVGAAPEAARHLAARHAHHHDCPRAAGHSQLRGSAGLHNDDRSRC